MALQVWLSLNGNLNNNGLSDVTVTNNGATVNDSGKIGECYYFNGSSYIAVDTDFSNYSTTSCSLSCWVKPPTASSGNKQILAIGTSSGWGNIRFGILYRTNDAKMLVSISNGNKYVAYNCPGEIIENSWNHVAAVYNNHLLSLYINGELAKTYTTDYDISFSGITKFGIGAASDGAEKFTGYINDVRIYNHALSPREVKQVSAALALHYPLSMPGQENMAVGTKNLSVTAYKSNMNCSKRGTSTVRLNDYGFYESQVTNSFGGLCVYANQYNFQVGDTVTMSFYIYTNGSTKSYSFYPMMYNSSGTRDTSTGIQTSIDGGAYTTVNAKSFGSISSTVPERHYVTFIWNQNVKDIIDNGGSIELSIQIHGNWQTGDWGSIFGLKFERGSHPTPWIPNPSDTEYSTLGFNDGIEYDVSGYRHNGTKYGTLTYSSDTPRYNTSTVFNGSSDIRSAKSSFGWFDFKEGTISAWYNPANTTQTWASVGVQSDNGQGSRSFSVCNYSGKAATVVGYDTSWGNVSSSFSMEANTWYHLCATITNGDTVKLYVNGELVQTRTVTNTTGTIASNTQFAIGVDLPGGDEHFTGKMSDVRFYTTCLNELDVRELYNTSMSLSDNGLLFGYEFIG